MRRGGTWLLGGGTCSVQVRDNPPRFRGCSPLHLQVPSPILRSNVVRIKLTIRKGRCRQVRLHRRRARTVARRPAGAVGRQEETTSKRVRGPWIEAGGALPNSSGPPSGPHGDSPRGPGSPVEFNTFSLEQPPDSLCRRFPVGVIGRAEPRPRFEFPARFLAVQSSGSPPESTNGVSVSRETLTPFVYAGRLLLRAVRRQDTHDSIQVINACELDADLALAGAERNLHVRIETIRE